jgi:hypothetical protein
VRENEEAEKEVYELDPQRGNDTGDGEVFANSTP